VQVSFGCAPAFAAFALGLRTPLDTVILTGFVCCGIARLARFNVTTASIPHDASGKARYFEGLPIPSSLILVGGMAVCLLAGRVDAGGLPIALAKERISGLTFTGALRDHIPGAQGGKGVPLGVIGLDLAPHVFSALRRIGLAHATAQAAAAYATLQLHTLSLVWLVWSGLLVSKTIRIPKP
jgi:CDP-diacylglycerol--serine O-phosphatidyltransferase